MAFAPPTLEEALEQDPNLAPFAEANEYEVSQLLLDPRPRMLSRIAFRRAAEAVARGSPAEALAWMRLARAVAQETDRIERDSRPFSTADYARATLAAQIAAIYEDAGSEEEGEPPEQT